MTRINTNVSSLVAQTNLKKSNAALDQALTRLSTGLRINTGKDDPAGLIASENLRSDITSVQSAISNTDRANEVISTADSALDQVSSLLNDIRGLVTEAANGGALSTDQIAANQLQIDSSLDALNRIAKTVTFQGRKLLDGSLDFTTSASTNFAKLSGLQIDQANLGATGQVSVDINVSSAATQAGVNIAGFTASTAAANATTSFNVTNTATQAAGTVTLDTTNNATVDLTALSGGTAAGAEGNGTKNLVIVDGASEGTSYNATSDTLTVTVDITGGHNTVADLVNVINAGTDYSAANTTNGTDTIAATNTGTGAFAGGRDAGSAAITVTADTAGAAANGTTVTVQEDSSITNNTAQASIVSGNILVKVHGTVTKAAIASAIDGLSGYSASAVVTGDTNYIEANDTPPSVATLGSGADAVGGLSQAVTFELSGASGSEVFSFGANTDIQKVADAINIDKDATGVQATVSGTTLTLGSTAYGSAAFVGISVISEATGGTISAAVGQGTRSAGTDVTATVNGIAATGKGNALSINTSGLSLNTTVQAGFTGSVDFDITGGGICSNWVRTWSAINRLASASRA